MRTTLYRRWIVTSLCNPGLISLMTSKSIVSCHDRLLVDGQASQQPSHRSIFRESCFRSVSCEQSPGLVVAWPVGARVRKKAAARATDDRRPTDRPDADLCPRGQRRVGHPPNLILGRMHVTCSRVRSRIRIRMYQLD